MLHCLSQNVKSKTLHGLHLYNVKNYTSNIMVRDLGNLYLLYNRYPHSTIETCALGSAVNNNTLKEKRIIQLKCILLS